MYVPSAQLEQLSLPVTLANVPRLTTVLHNQSRRFITLIDVLYERRVRVVVLADAEPSKLFTMVSVSTQNSTATTAYNNLVAGGSADPAAGTYALSYSPDGSWLVAAAVTGMLPPPPARTHTHEH